MDQHLMLFHLGQKSSGAVKAFTVSGKTDILKEQSQRGDGLFSANLPPLHSPRWWEGLKPSFSWTSTILRKKSWQALDTFLDRPKIFSGCGCNSFYCIRQDRDPGRTMSKKRRGLLCKFTALAISSGDRKD